MLVPTVYAEPQAKHMGDGRDITIFTLKQRKRAVICDYRRGQSLTTLLGWGGGHTESREA